MPVLKIYATNMDDKPKIVFSGAKWIWNPENNSITVWFEDKYFDFPCEELDRDGNFEYLAYGEVVPTE